MIHSTILGPISEEWSIPSFHLHRRWATYLLCAIAPLSVLCEWQEEQELWRRTTIHVQNEWPGTRGRQNLSSRQNGSFGHKLFSKRWEANWKSPQQTIFLVQVMKSSSTRWMCHTCAFPCAAFSFSVSVWFQSSLSPVSISVVSIVFFLFRLSLSVSVCFCLSFLSKLHPSVFLPHTHPDSLTKHTFVSCLCLNHMETVMENKDCHSKLHFVMNLFWLKVETEKQKQVTVLVQKSISDSALFFPFFLVTS